jgi:hypothetical protein
MRLSINFPMSISLESACDTLTTVARSPTREPRFEVLAHYSQQVIRDSLIRNRTRDCDRACHRGKRGRGCRLAVRNAGGFYPDPARIPRSRFRPVLKAARNFLDYRGKSELSVTIG